MATLPDMLRVELARCHPLARSYDAMGSAGAFACALLDKALLDAEKALREGNPEAMQASVEKLRSFRDVMPDRTPARVLRPAAWTVAAKAQARAAAPAAPAWTPPAQELFFTWTRAA